jgi:hypothetical protein
MAPPIHPPTRKLLTAVALSTAPLLVLACGSDDSSSPNGSGGFANGTVALDAGDDATVTPGEPLGTIAADAGAPDDGAIIMVGTVITDAGNVLDAGTDAADAADGS